MSNIQRFNFDGFDGGMVPKSDGGWMFYADHAAELARVEASNALLRAECEAARKCWIICNHEYTIKGEDVDALANARAATDAAGALKGVE